VYYRDLSIDPSNFHKPVTNLRANKFFMTSADTYKEGYLLTKHIELETDTGLILDDKNSKFYAGFSEFFETFAIMPRNEMFFNLYVKLDPKGEVVNRSYMKLEFVLAEVESMITIYFIIITMVIGPFEKFQFYKEFIKNMRIKANKFEKNHAIFHLDAEKSDNHVWKRK